MCCWRWSRGPRSRAFARLCRLLGPRLRAALGRFRGALGAFGLIVIAGQTLTRLDGGRVARNVANDSILLGVADQCFVYFGRQAGGGELGEGTRKGGFGGHLRGAVPAAEAAQLAVALQALNEMACAGQIVNSLGEEGAGERAAIAGRAARVGAPAFHKARQRL